MSGTTSRRGFRFQDYYLLQRILDDMTSRRSAALAGLQQPALVTFGVETPLDAQAGTPDWDTLVIGVQQTEVIEAKSGQVSPEDRKTFWLRVRSELRSAGNGHESIIPVLVSNADNRPAGIKYWQKLHTGAADDDVNATQVPASEPTNNLTSSKVLVKEALYWLCGPTAIHFTKRDGNPGIKELGPAIPEDVARAALRRFKLVELSDSSLEREVESKLELLTVGPDAAPIRRQLGGWLDDRATARAGDVKQFTSDDVLGEVQVLRRLLAGSPEAFALARALRQRYTTSFVDLCETSVTLPGGLHEVALENAQPHLTQYRWAALPRSVVIVGDAGQGKSRVLLHLYRKLVSIGTGTDLLAAGAEALAEHLGAGATAGAVLSEAFQLLADFAALQGSRVTMLVDGIDQVGPETSFRIANILGSASTHSAFKAVISCRRPDWHARQRLQSHLVGWDQLNLQDWPDSLVDGQLNMAGVTRDLTPSLRELVRNPLYLDLLVRTFGHGISIPMGLQTRHGLFRAFWDIQVFGDQQDVRWQLLSQGCESLAVNGRWTPSTGDADRIEQLSHLLSIGLLVRVNNRGQFDFRHPLLRDFAMAQWALAVEQPATVRQRIQSVGFPLHRFGAHRALVEAICEAGESPYASSFGLRDYVGEQPPPDLIDELVDVLGELTPSDQMDPQVWASDLKIDVASRLFRSAQYHLNFAWLQILAAWSTSPSWADQHAWLGTDTLRALADYGAVATEAVLQGDRSSSRTLLPHLAQLVREWSHAKRFALDVQQGTSLVSRLIPLVARWHVNESTLRWLAGLLDAGTWYVRLDVLEAIPVLAEGIAHEQPDMVADLVSLYRSAIGLPEGQFDFKPEVWNYPTMDDRAVDWCLMGVASASGGVPLLDALPRAFLPVTLDMLTAATKLKITESARSAKGLAEALTLIVNQGEADSGETDVLANNSLESAPEGDLLDDYPDQFWRQTGHGFQHRLLHGLKSYMQRWLKDDPDWFLNEACPQIRQCRVATLQTLLLHLRLDVSNDPSLAKSVRGMLWDRKLYGNGDLLYWLERLMLAEWNGLRMAEQSAVLDAVRGTVDANPFNRILVGQFVSRLPASDLPQDLVQLVNEARISGFAPFFSDPRRGRIVTPPPTVPRPGVTPAIIGTWQPPISQQDMATFYECCNSLPFNELPAPSDIQITEAIDIVQIILPTLTTGVEQLVSRPWPLQMLELVLTHTQRSADPHGPSRLDPTVLAEVANLAVVCLEFSPLPSADGAADAFQTRYHGDSWSRSLSLADQSLSLDTTRHRKDLRDRVFHVLVRAFKEHNPVAQSIALVEWRAEQWLRSDDTRDALLEDLLTEHVRSGPVLETSVPLLYDMDFKASDRLVRALLATNDVQQADDFCFLLGEFLGIRSLVVLTSGARLPAATLLDEISADTSRYALVAEPVNAAALLWGITRGLSIQAELSVSEAYLAKDYGNWLSRVWNQLQQYRAFRRQDRPSSFILYSLYWLGHRDDPDDSVSARRTWWSELLPLVQTIAHSGPRDDVQSAMFNLREQLAATIAPPTDLFGVVDLFIQRLQALTSPAELDATNPDNQEWHSWRDCARYAAEVIDVVCRRAGLPDTEVSRGYQLLQALAADPIKLQDALRRLTVLRSDLESG